MLASLILVYSFLYILIGFLTFKIYKNAEDNAKYIDQDWYQKFYSKPKYYRIIKRLCRFIFWPFIITYYFFNGLYMFIINFYKDLVE